MKWLATITLAGTLCTIVVALQKVDHGPPSAPLAATAPTHPAPRIIPDATSDPSRAEIEAMQRKLARLERALTQALDQTSAPPMPTAPATTHRPSPPSPVVDNMLAEILADEPADRTWSDDTEAHIEAVFADLIPEGGEVLAIECRSTLCRLEAEYDTVETFDRFLAEAPHREPFLGESFFRQLNTDAAEAPRFVWYVARTGHTLRDHLPAL